MQPILSLSFQASKPIEPKEVLGARLVSSIPSGLLLTKKLLALNPDELGDEGIYPDIPPVIVPNDYRNVTQSL